MFGYLNQEPDNKFDWRVLKKMIFQYLYWMSGGMPFKNVEN